MIKLMKVEMYRFIHSLNIMKYAIIGSIFICFVHAIDFINMESYSSDLVWKNLENTVIYMIIIYIGVICTYIGREFRQKTLYYEVMNGYKATEICTTKILICGVLVSLLALFGVLLYLAFFGGIFDALCLVRIGLLWIIIMHCTVCITLYTILIRSGVLGGILSFGRFVLLEIACAAIFLLFPAKIQTFVAPHLLIVQWVALARKMPSVSDIIAIVVDCILEVLILLMFVKRSFRKRDFI